MLILKLLPLGLACGILQAILGRADNDRLVRRLKARDSKAMADLYDRYGRAAYSLILRIVRNPSTAEDLMQETFLRVWNRVHSFDAGTGDTEKGDAKKGALGAWVLTIARNRAIDHLRSVDGRGQAGATDLDRLENPRHFSAINTDALSLERVRRLKSAFENLTPHQRQVIEIAYYEGLSQTEMADRLRQPLDTVKTWTRGALQTLRGERAGAAIA